MPRPMTYEAAVYDDECMSIMRAILDACSEASKIPDKRVRCAIIASAMKTAAQVLDGNDMPRESSVLKPGGIAAGLAALLHS